MKSLKLLAISGSLRANSSNTLLLEALAEFAPEGVEIVLYHGLGDLPHFNPDLDTETPPFSVSEFRRQPAEADGVIICSPEYAHGVPGVLKNALDWVVSSGETVLKPFALINASPRSTYALASLREILKTMATILVRGACVTVPFLGSKLDRDGIVAHPEIAPLLRSALLTLVEAICSPEPLLYNEE